VKKHWSAVALTVVACVVATVGTLAVIAAGFALSFDAIETVGEAASMNPRISWLLPVSIDGVMAVATITAIVLRFAGRSSWYPWLVVIVGVAISVWCNATHAGLRGGVLDLGERTAAAVSAIPAVTLFLSVHLLITLALAVVTDRAPAAPATVTQTDTDEVADTTTDTAEDVAEAADESAGSGVSADRYTSEQARTVAVALKEVFPDMTAAEIGRYVGRSPRHVTRLLAPASREEVTAGASS
jgi:hypothetical protein